MKNSRKCTTLLVLLGSALILQPSPASAASNIDNKEEKLAISTTNYIMEAQLNDVLVTTTTSAVTKINVSSAITLNDLQNKINDVAAKVEQDKNLGVTFATDKLSELYLDAAKVDGTLPYFQSIIDTAKQLIQTSSVDENAIKTAYNAIDTAYNTLRTIKTYDSFSGTDGGVWKDTNGVPIQAHGGQVQKIGGKWWWYGEDKTKGYRSNGISAYSSDDLYNWTFEGYVMRTISKREQLDTDPYFSEVYKEYTVAEKDNVYLCFNDSRSVIERPKMIYNEKTGKYVLWFHADGPTVESPDSDYAAAMAGVAISDSPNGPFKFLGRYRLNVCPEADKKGEWYEKSAGFARDMNLWVDDDGTAYIIYSSEENRTMFISKLNADYTNLATDVDNAVKGIDFVRLFPGAQREAPALFKYNGKYYMITSSATGWDPNQAKYWVADSILGEWSDIGDPCIGDTDRKTFYSQSTNVITVDKNSGKFIYMGDRWNSHDLPNSRYIWLPLEFDSNGKLLMKPYTNWKLENLNNKYSVQLNTKLKDVYTDVADIPKTLSIKVYENGQLVDKDTTVTWNIPELKPMVQTNITGVLDAVGREIKTSVIDIPNNLKYYIDCGNTKSKEYDLANNKVVLKNNDTSDKAYTKGSWGYSSKIGTDIDLYSTTSTDSFQTGYWAQSGKTIDYVASLEAGNYNLYAGFNEWWGANRTMGISISYKDASGQIVKQNLGTFTNSSQKTVDYSFKLPVDSDVTISVYKPNSSNPDVILSWLAIQFDNVEVPIEENPNMKDLYTGIDELPQTLNIKAFENNEWVSKNTTVKWDISTLTPMVQTTVTGTLGYSGRKIQANVLNIPKNLQYYVDCGAKNSSTIYDLINKKVKLMNNQVCDQAYTKESWGYIGKIGTDIGYKNEVDSANPYNSGFWAYDGKNIDYAVPLKAGNYNLFAGFNEWWGANRTMGMSVSYKNLSGEIVKQELGTFTSSGKKDVNYTFNLPQDAEVTISVYRHNSNNPNVILSWFALENIIPEYAINVEVGEHGSISPSGSVNVEKNQSKTLTITPDDGYEISDVKVDGASVGAVSSYAFKDVTKAHTIIATFKVKNSRPGNSLSINVEVGEHGSISPNGAINVEKNQSETFTITPDDGYEISDVKVDGVSVGAVGSYTFKDVTEVHTISAIFKVKNSPANNSLSINVEVGKHGSISPSGSVNVEKNQSKTFIITPDTGYKINDVKVDGVSVGAVSSYVFKDVTKAHTISATFKVKNSPSSSSSSKNSSSSANNVSDTVITKTDEASIINAINSRTTNTIVIDVSNTKSTHNIGVNAVNTGITGNTPLISKNIIKDLKTNVDKTLVIKAADSSIEIKSKDGQIQFTENGVAVTGFKLVGQAEYYLNERGIMQTGWVQTPEKSWYHLNLETGIKEKNWIKETNGNWYYLDNNSGAMKIGWVKDNATWYYLNNDGTMKTGWLKESDGSWYYLDISGAMASNTTIDGYQLGENGALI